MIATSAPVRRTVRGSGAVPTEPTIAAPQSDEPWASIGQATLDRPGRDLVHERTPSLLMCST